MSKYTANSSGCFLAAMGVAAAEEGKTLPNKGNQIYRFKIVSDLNLVI